MEWIDAYSRGRKEHAFLLRCEGLKFAEIGPRMGFTSRQEARRLTYAFSRKLARAITRTKFTMKDSG